MLWWGQIFKSGLTSGRVSTGTWWRSHCLGQSQTRGNYCPGSTPGKVRCRELGRSCSSLAVIKEGKLELPVCCCMQIVSFVPVSNSSPCRMSRMCNNPAGMCTQRCQEMRTCRFLGVLWGAAWETLILPQVYKEIIQLSGVSLRSRHTVRRIMFHLGDLGVWSQHKWHLTNTKCSPAFCPHSGNQESITWALLLSHSHFSLSSSTQNFM